MQEVKTKTFIAPCVGGLLDGRLVRYPNDLEHFIVPQIDLYYGMVYRCYDRVRLADGSTIWQYAEHLCR